MTVQAWSIAGSDGEPILGDAHLPEGTARGVALVAHGFKGYKDYGMFPRIATTLAAAGFIAHRFNFSHSGMTAETETFARPDLFERDTWNRQVDDVRAILAGIASGALPGGGLPAVLFGHSRGGVTVLLTAGREPERLPVLVTGVITAAAPSTCLSMSPGDLALLERDGFLLSPSSRTGQELRIGGSFVDEQRADPDGHDLLAVARGIRCPVLVVHGTADATVPVTCMNEIAEAVGAEATTEAIEGGDHVFKTPNPLDEGAASSPQLATLLQATTAFASRVCGA